jgi:hypothetical protein
MNKQAEIDANPEKVRILGRDRLAIMLGISPKERLEMTLVQADSPDRVAISVLLDGGDLTPEQLKVLEVFLKEAGALNVLGIFPERPTTS